MKIGYIQQIDTKMNPGREKFRFCEATYQRIINSRGDKIKSKMLLFAVDYEEVKMNTALMRKEGMVLVREPFFLDDELREKATRWVEWANSVDEKEYDFFYKENENE